MQALTRAGGALASAGLTLLSAGILFGNVELLLLSAFPLLLMADALVKRPTRPPRATRTLSTRAPRRGDPIDVSLRVEIPPGHEVLEVHAPLPPSFTLESGSNLFLRAGHGAAVGAFRARPQSRGPHEMAPVVGESIDATGVLAPQHIVLAPGEAIEVTPRLARRGRFRGRLRGRGRQAFAAVDESRLGARSTDFRELRDYAWGDPASAIHWRATAKRLSAARARQHAAPIVSEYEREGRRTVLILLDGGPALRVGTQMSTGLDHGVEAALTIAGLFLDGGSRVGAATYNAHSGPPAYPDAGEGRFALLERALAAAEPDPSLTLASTLERLHGHLAGGSPFLVVVTRITPDTAPQLIEGARRLRRLLGERRRALPLLVLDVRALHLAPTPSAAWAGARDVIEREDEHASASVRAAGARVIPWRPDTDDLLKTFLGRGLA